MEVTGIDVDWMRQQLAQFIEDTSPRNMSGGSFITTRSGPTAPEREVLAQLETIEPILDRLYPEWRQTMPLSSSYRFNQQYEGAHRCLARLDRQAELHVRLGGSSAPQLGADELHPWIWDAARPQWESGHFGGAVARRATTSTRGFNSGRVAPTSAVPTLCAKPSREMPPKRERRDCGCWSRTTPRLTAACRTASESSSQAASRPSGIPSGICRPTIRERL